MLLQSVYKRTGQQRCSHLGSNGESRRTAESLRESSFPVGFPGAKMVVPPCKWIASPTSFPIPAPRTRTHCAIVIVASLTLVGSNRSTSTGSYNGPRVTSRNNGHSRINTWYFM